MDLLFLSRSKASGDSDMHVSFTSVNENVREASGVESGKVLVY